jgi:alkylation response protein AidB-like acyl-CoA dehydrogenase
MAMAQHRYHEQIETLATKLAATAVERDKAGGHAAHERELMRESGLLTMAIPVQYGGLGASWSEIYQSIRRLAEVDSALAHLFAFQHLQVTGIFLYANEAQKDRYLTQTARGHLFWGNAVNSADRRLFVTENDDGSYTVQGVKGFCSGTRGSDMMLVSAWHEASQRHLVIPMETSRAGITVHEEWDPIGQRQTDSGAVSFDNVQASADEVLRDPGPDGTAFATLRPCVAQLILVNLYLGIALGAFAEARRYTLEQARPWVSSGVSSVEDDPYIVRRYADMWLQLKPAILLADAAIETLQQAWNRGPALTAEERGKTALAIAEAKVLAHRAGLDVSTQMFDVMGARSAMARFGYDRFWRNVRTHTLHDPIDYKLRDIGRWALSGELPTPGTYS